ncbi:MAG TPA: hypothetical protein VGM86_01605 [Thermoanaerobaculia bacterium]|jgi:hypothetical protein
MRFSIVALLLAVQLVAPPAARAQLGSQYKGQIVYKGGDTSSFTSFWSTLAGDKFPYSRDVRDMKGSTLDLPMVRLAGVSRIDFIEPTSDEKKLIAAQGRPATRKATVTFRDGKKLEKIFLDVTLSKWTGPHEEGSLESEQIVAMVFNSK